MRRARGTSVGVVVGGGLQAIAWVVLVCVALPMLPGLWWVLHGGRRR